MSKFQLLNIASVFCLLVILTVDEPLVVSIVILALVYLGILTLGSFFIQLNFYMKSLNKGQTTQKQIALTFDDGPDQMTTPTILSLLEKHKVNATFFCIGSKIEQHKELLQQIDNSGHLIGNHSYSHSNLFAFLSLKKMDKDLAKTNALITQACGKKPRLFRPPFGVSNPTIARALKSNDLISVGWSLRSLDTIWPGDKVFRKLKRQLKAGDVVLFHDRLKSTPEILESFLPWLHTNGFEVIGIDEMFNIEVYEKE